MFDASTAYGNGPFVIMDVDSFGRKSIELPDGGSVPHLPSAVSPDSRWLAFHTGSTESPYDLALNLLSLSDGRVHSVTSLLSDEYPQNLSLVVEALPSSYTEDHPAETDWLVQVKSAFLSGIHSLAWSPDGQYIAFAGQIDGPSSDLYLFEPETNTVRRLTDDLQNIKSLDWSPDGKWILFENSIPGEIYEGATLHVARPELQGVQSPRDLESGFWWRGLGWISPKYYLITGTNDSGGLQNLRTLNIETGQVTNLWSDVYLDYAIDYKNDLVALSTMPSGYSFADPAPHAEDGFYFLTLYGRQKKVSEKIYWNLEFLGNLTSQFIGSDGQKIEGIDEAGSSTTICDWVNDSNTHSGISVSPDRRWFVLYNKEGMELFNRFENNVRTFPYLNATNLHWRPDSQGIFLELGNGLYYFAVPNGGLRLVHQCPSELNCYRNFVWLRWETNTLELETLYR
jgi:WD40 repeat protein